MKPAYLADERLMFPSKAHLIYLCLVVRLSQAHGRTLSLSQGWKPLNFGLKTNLAG